MNKKFMALLLTLLLVTPVQAKVYFDGANAFAISSSVYDISDTNGSICFWFNSNRAFTAGNMNFVFRAYTISPFRVIDIIFYSDGNTYVGWYNNGTEGRIVMATSGTGMTQSEWHHVAVTWVDAGVTTLWVDGISRGSASYVAGSRWDVGAGNGYNIGLYGTEGIDGYLEDFRIFDRVLRDDEIINLHSSRSFYPITDGLFAWYKLGDGQDSQSCIGVGVIRDYSGNGRTLDCSTTGATYPLFGASTWLSYP